MSFFQNPSIGGVAVMSEFNNGVLATYDQVNTPHPLIDAAIASSMLDGWTFKGPLSGTFTSVTNAGGGQIQVTTSAPHGMVAGDIVFLSSSTAAGYSPPNPTIFVIQSVGASTFNVIATFTATATGNWNRGCSLIAGANAAGNYRVSWSLSMSPVGNNKVWEARVTQNVTQLNGTAAESVMTNAGAQNIGNSLPVTVAAGDVFTLAVINETDATDFTARYFTLSLVRYQQ